MSQDYNPSMATIERAVLFTYGTPPGGEGVNITAMITGFSLQQSIEQNSYLGTILVEDRVGLLENALPTTKDDARSTGYTDRNLTPLRGEERLQLTVKGYDLSTIVNMDVRVYKIDGISPTSNGDGKTFSMHFTSTVSFNTIGKRICEPMYDMFASTAARKVFDNYYDKLTKTDNYFLGVNSAGNQTKKKNDERFFVTDAYTLKSEPDRTFFVQRTEGTKRLLIPNLNPAESMNFLTRESFSTKSASCTYRFFETVDGYYFVTDEWLIKYADVNESEIIPLTYDPYGSMDPRQTETHIRQVEGLSYPLRVDTSADFFSGGYRNNVIEIDINRRRVINNRFNYLEDANFLDINNKKTQRNDRVEDDVHSEPFLKDWFNKDSERTFMVVRDYGTQPNASPIVKNEQYFSEIVSNRIAYNHHINRTPLTLELKGRLDIKAGKVIDLSIKEQSALSTSKKDPHQQLSGRYLVKESLHTLEDNVLSTKLSVTKFDWST